MQFKEVRIRVPWPRIQGGARWKHFLPTPGNMICTLVMIGLLVAAQSVGALPLSRPLDAPEASSTGTVAYQGRLADSAGAPLTGTYNMIFRMYTASSGGTPLWEEQWTGPSGVRISDGLFNVMLGSLQQLPQTVIAEHDQLFLGIAVGTDNEMAPRVQLGSVPYATHALTVPDGSVTTTKLSDGAVTQAKLGADVRMVPPDGSVTTAKLADGAVTQAKLAADVMIPFVPRVLRFVNRQNDIVPSCSASGATHVIETIVFSLPSPAAGYIAGTWSSDSTRGTAE